MRRFTLVLAVAGLICAGAARGGTVELGSTYEGVASWTTETAAPGGDGASAKLYWPAPYNDPNGKYITPNAWVLVDVPDTLVSDVSSWSYWTKAPEDYAANLTFYVDTPAANYSGKDYDTTINAWPQNNPPLADNWMKVDQATIGGYVGAYVVWTAGSGSPSYKFTWSAVQSGYGSGTVLRLVVGKGVIGTSLTITDYADDLTFNGTSYPFVPEPATMILLGLGGFVLIRRRRR